MNHIEVKGARIHNLKNISVKIPKNQIIAITGVSGSGKSSLAFDILFEEGRRRYLQSIGLPTYFEKEKHFDMLNGLSPTVAVEQRTSLYVNPRSTVGTKTGIYNLLRQFYVLESKNNGTLKYRNFTFNEPTGWCPKCKGLGYIQEFHERKLIPDPTKNLLQICEAGSAAFGSLKNFTIGLADAMNFDINTPYNQLPKKIQNIFLYGSDEKLKIKWTSRRFDGVFDAKFEGVIPYLRRVLAKTSSAYRINKIEKEFMTKITCPSCQGNRVKEQTRNALINGRHIGELSDMPFDELTDFLKKLDGSNIKTNEGKSIKNEIITRLEKTKLAGISYLSLNRSMRTLSGGEAQRLNLITHLNNGLDSLVFILDEPSMGMHEIEKNNLMTLLKEINNLGNSVIIVEHDRNIISKSDQIIDLGPGAGRFGGMIVFQGTVDEIKKDKNSITGKYLSGKYQISTKKGSEKRKLGKSTKFLVMRNVSTNNLKKLEVKIPLGCMVGVAGVSGCGKSSLIGDTLVPLLREHFSKNNDEIVEEFIQIDEIKGKLSGWENISDCVVISQSPIGRVKTSIPISYIGIWDNIRRLFSKQVEAKKRKYDAGHFSFNSNKGGCPNCNGAGSTDLQISFSTKIDLPCEICNGSRYKSEILDVRYKGKNIHEILNMTVSESLDIFNDEPAILKYLKILDEIGMGYITLGQPVTTLSGGEAQRIKLAKELGKTRKSKTLYVLDEPTTGLHDYDVQKLLKILDRLVEQGNTVLIIEHNIDILSYVDYLIELGPEGGPKGGKIIATGSSEEVKMNEQSKTAPFLHL